MLDTLRVMALTGIFAFVGASTAYAAPSLPSIDSATFSNPTKITNQWLSLPIGTALTYEGETEDGTEVVKISISGETKTVMGIKTLVYRDKVYVDDELVEDTRDYLAQDDKGNVWYFGEDVDNYEDGKLVDHGGSWLAGTDGAKPGYWMPVNPKVGDSYYQEYYKGEAEDQAEVVSVTTTVDNDLERYTQCLKTKDTTALEPGIIEYKYYCKQVAAQVLEEKPADNERVELISVMRPGSDDDEQDDDDDEGEDEDEAGDLDEVDDEDDDGQVAVLQQRLMQLLQQLIALLRGN